MMQVTDSITKQTTDLLLKFTNLTPQPISMILYINITISNTIQTLRNSLLLKDTFYSRLREIYTQITTQVLKL